MQADDRVRLQHMLEAALEATGFADGRSRSDLEEDRMLQHCLVRLVAIVGEAADRVSEEARQRLPDVAWTGAVGMRHRLVHAYYNVDLDLVWETVTRDLPSLIDAVRPVMAASYTAPPGTSESGDS